MSAAKHSLSDDEDSAGPGAGPKKHHFTPLELQKKQLDKLLEKIDKPVHIPERPNEKRTTKEPKDYVKNVQGSSAGAGSGEFHVYRAGRRREYARLKNMELESKEVKKIRRFMRLSLNIVMSQHVRAVYLNCERHFYLLYSSPCFLF